MGTTNLHLRCYFNQPSYLAGQPIKLSVTLSDEQPILNAQILAVVGPLVQAGRDMRATDPFMNLYDDGDHSDGLANDGVYANTLSGWVIDTEGTYTFSVFASGIGNNGQLFNRQFAESIFVGSNAEFPYLNYMPLIIR